MDINLSTSIKYGYLKSYLKVAREYEKKLEKVKHRFSEILELPSDISIALKPIRSLHIVGRYNGDANIAEIDIRKGNIDEGLLTICHELVHAEQYHIGTLYSDEKYFYWKGKKWPEACSKTTAYYKLPWEIEAYNKQEEIYNLVFN